MFSNKTNEIKLEITSIRNMTSFLYSLDWNFAVSEHIESRNLKVRVTMKSKIQTYKNEDGSSGIYCHIYLKDGSGEIGAVLFNEECKKYYDEIEIGKVYTISNKFKVQKSLPEYRNPKNEFEIIFRFETVLKEVEDDGRIPSHELVLLPISDIYNLRQNESVNTIGICAHVGELEYFHRYDGKPLKKRNLILEEYEDFIEVKLWGDRAEISPKLLKGKVVLLEGSHYNYNDFDGKISLEISYKTSVFINPDIPQTYYFDNFY